MDRFTKAALYVTAAILFTAGTAVAGGPPWSGGPGGPGNNAASFDQWASGSVMSGSMNDFGVSGNFVGAGGGLAGFTANGWNSGTANVSGGFTDTGFTGHADSWNSGAASALTGGFGDVRHLEFNAGSMGQSFGEMNFRFDNRD